MLLYVKWQSARENEHSLLDREMTRLVLRLEDTLKAFYQGDDFGTKKLDTFEPLGGSREAKIASHGFFQKLMGKQIGDWENTYPDLSVTFSPRGQFSELHLGWKGGWCWVTQNSRGLEVARVRGLSKTQAFSPSEGEYLQEGRNQGGVKVLILGPSGKIWGEFALSDLVVSPAA